MTAQLTVATADGRNFVRPINRDEFAVGRDSRNHLVLGDRQVSKFHCTIFKREGSYFVRDLGSSNGTLVNGIRSDGEVPVATGDRLRVGPYELIFAVEGDELALPPRPVTMSGVTQSSGRGGREDTTTSKQAGREDPQAPSRRAVEIPEPALPMEISGEIHSTYSTSEGGGAGRAYLEIVDGDGKGHMITIGSRGLTIGAGSRNHLVLDDPFVSRQHARVDRDGERYLVRDLGSTNGIRVDSHDVAESMLEDGTRLQVGGVLMVFRWPAAPAESSGAISDLPQPRARPATSPGGPERGQPVVQHREPTTAPGAPVVSPQTGSGAPNRAGRTSSTVREMDAVMTSTLTMSASQDSLKPEVRSAAPPPGERGVFKIGTLRFKRWQVLILGFFGGLLVIALLYQVGSTVFRSSGVGERQPAGVLFESGKAAYLSGDWATAEGYLEAVPVGGADYTEAQQYLENIRVESENAERVDRIAILMDEGVFYRAFEIAQEIPPNSRYYDEAQELVARPASAEAKRLVVEASAHLEAKEVDEAVVLLDRAEAYDAEVEGLAELRAAIEEGPEAARQAAQEHGGVGTPTLAEPGSDGGRGEPSQGTASKTAAQAVAMYLEEDVGGARSKLEKGIDRAGSAAVKMELMDALGRIDRIERAFAAGNKAMDAGDLDVSLDRFESAYRDITRLDTSGKSQRRKTIREKLADCLYERGQQAYDRREYKRAAFEWNKGRKAWSEHDGIEEGRKRLEMVAKDIYNDAVVSEREGNDSGRDEARRLYEDVLDIAPQGGGFRYYDKAQGKLENL